MQNSTIVLLLLDKERKDRIILQENRIIEEVKEQIRKLKGIAVQDFIRSLGSIVASSESIDSHGPVSPSLVDDSIAGDVLMMDGGEEILCTICQDSIVRQVTLPVNIVSASIAFVNSLKIKSIRVRIENFLLKILS